jgi:glycosyltransferase involved in cell wall biosynthesis
MMPKVVHFSPSLEQGGAERMLVEITSRDAAHGHVIVTLLGGRQFFDRQTGARVLALGPRNKLLALLLLPLSAARALLLLRALRPEWTVGWLYYGCLFACLGKLVGARVLWSLHATELKGARRYWLTRAARHACGMLSRTRWTDRIQYCAEASRIAHERRGYAWAKSVIVHNGIDAGMFQPLPSSGLRDRSRFAADPADAAAPWIGCVARFEAQKDHACLFGALRLLKRRGHPFRCVLAGRGCERNNAALARLIATHGCAEVTLPLGTVDDVAALYRTLDVLVLASCYGEAMPLVLLEALASGCPVVATDVGSNRDVVGAFGAIVPPRDPEALADAIARTLAAAVTMEWRMRAHTYISQAYGISPMIDAWHELIGRAPAIGAGQVLRSDAAPGRAAGLALKASDR